MTTTKQFLTLSAATLVGAAALALGIAGADASPHAPVSRPAAATSTTLPASDGTACQPVTFPADGDPVDAGRYPDESDLLIWSTDGDDGPILGYSLTEDSPVYPTEAMAIACQ